VAAVAEHQEWVLRGLLAAAGWGKLVRKRVRLLRIDRNGRVWL